MLFRRFYDENLAQASYLVGCERTHEALVVDPTLDTAQYVRAAGAERLRITQVTETHIHADFVSGSAALAEATGATLNLSGDGGSQYGYTPAALKRAHVLRNGSTITVGDVRVEAIHTPGHTPEHMTFLVADVARGPEALGAFTGDFLFVGDVGRPDLLEKAVGVRGSMESSARDLYRSVRAFARRPDHLQIWPGHGAGSACGKQLGLMPQSTLGYEKLFNWAFNADREDEFVNHVLENQPVPPRYFAVMKRINRELGEFPGRMAPRRLEVGDLADLIADGAFVVDTRAAERFAKLHVPGTLNIPYNKSFLNWSGALVPYDCDVALILESDSDETFDVVCSNLHKIGLYRITGFAAADIVGEWKARGKPVERVAQVEPASIASGGERPVIIDVRAPDEWRQGHLPGALHIPLAALPDRLAEIDATRPVVLQCKGGGRSSIACSFLQMAGRHQVSNMTGGYEAWVACGLETVREEAPPPRTNSRRRKPSPRKSSSRKSASPRKRSRK